MVVIENTIREVGDVIIVSVVGQITLGKGAGGLRDITTRLVAEGKKKVILNMSETTDIDASGIGQLINGSKILARCGEKLKLLSLNARVREVIKITKLHTYFDVYEKEEEAIQSFQ